MICVTVIRSKTMIWLGNMIQNGVVRTTVFFILANSLCVAVEPDSSRRIAVLLQHDGWKILDKFSGWVTTEGALIARAEYRNQQLETGWNLLEIETNGEVDDKVQAEAAGILEGFLTRTFIVEHFKEFYSNDICSTNKSVCDFAKTRFQQNKVWIDDQIKLKQNNDSYWHMVDLFYTQMKGIAKGLKMKEEDEGLESDIQMDYDLGIIMVNFMPDFWDLVDEWKLTEKINDQRLKRKIPSCSALVKYLPQSNEVVFGHNAWFVYRAMSFRFLKLYKLNYHLYPGSQEFVPSRSISMSSYAGTIISMDDFYLSNSGLAAMETTLYVYNKELYRNRGPENVVYEGARVMAAMRLADNTQTWTKIFSKFNSGTYNNQWMVMDLKILNQSDGTLPDNFFRVLEQLPGKIVAEDQTQVLREKTFWSSYNRAFYPEIYELSGAPGMVEKYGQWFTYNNTPRANIFKREQSKVKDVESLMSLLRFNDFENDPFAIVEGCTPSSNPAGSIANRLDLGNPNTTCVFAEFDEMVTFSGYGALDAKVGSSKSLDTLNIFAVAGPTHNGVHPPFNWSNTEVTPKPAFRPIEVFDFEPAVHKWNIDIKEGGSQRQSSNLIRRSESSKSISNFGLVIFSVVVFFQLTIFMMHVEN